MYPPAKFVSRCLFETPYDQLKAVILGQDPYHGKDQATGLAFGVNRGMPRPPSLRNIINELQVDLGVEVDQTACTLEGWARQGVLLLNTTMTVEDGAPGSHKDIGWHLVTDEIIRAASDKGGIAFMLWGAHAKTKAKLINGHSNLILSAGHPSPLSVRHFYGCRHFSQTNTFLVNTGRAPVDWTKIDLE